MHLVEVVVVRDEERVVIVYVVEVVLEVVHLVGEEVVVVVVEVGPQVRLRQIDVEHLEEGRDLGDLVEVAAGAADVHLQDEAVGARHRGLDGGLDELVRQLIAAREIEELDAVGLLEETAETGVLDDRAAATVHRTQLGHVGEHLVGYLAQIVDAEVLELGEGGDAREAGIRHRVAGCGEENL